MIPVQNTLQVVCELIERESITPNDGGCINYLADKLTELGFLVTELEFSGVKNLWAVHNSNNSNLYNLKEQNLMFLGHVDVVPPGDIDKWNSPPFTPTIKGDTLYGRGAVDMKGGIAAMLNACGNFIEENGNNYNGSIAWLITADEEGVADFGTKAVLEWLLQQKVSINSCLIGEPASANKLGDQVKIGRRGSLNGFLSIRGMQGHVAYTKGQDNIIHKILPALNKLANIDLAKKDNYFPATEFHIVRVKADGGAVNVVPGDVEIAFNLRFSPKQNIAGFKQNVNDILAEFDYTLEWQLSANPFFSEPKKLAKICKKAICKYTKMESGYSTSGGTSDGRFFPKTYPHTEIVELGPVNTSAHQVNEYTSIKELETVSVIYKEVIELFFHINN